MIKMTRLGDDTTPATGTSEYSGLTDAACALIPACAVARGLSEAAQGVATDTLQQAQQTATQVIAPVTAQLQRLESTITWAAVGTIVALVAATGTVVWVAVRKRR